MEKLQDPGLSVPGTLQQYAKPAAVAFPPDATSSRESYNLVHDETGVHQVYKVLLVVYR